MVSTIPVLAAGPRIILVTGGQITKPVVLEDWLENLEIMEAASKPVDANAEALPSRPAYRIAMFWGTEWEQYVDAGKDPAALRPEHGNQFARYYPPFQGREAVFTFDTIPGPGALIRRLENKGVVIFARHGIVASGLPGAALSPTYGPSLNIAALPSGLVIAVALALGIGGLWFMSRAVRRRRNRRSAPVTNADTLRERDGSNSKPVGRRLPPSD